MEFLETLKQIAAKRSKVLVVGLGISGIEAATFLAKAGVPALAVERESWESYQKKSKLHQRIQELRSLGLELHFGVDGELVAPLLSGVELCVLSPGVSLESAIVGAVSRHAIKLVSELELGIMLRGGEFMAVTGSNGKSTSVCLLEAILQRAGLPVFLCGNVGIPVMAGLSGQILHENNAAEQKLVQVVEASSYQLETCTILKPKIAILLNVSDNHLERHGSIERYLACKAKLFANQTSDDIAILNFDDKRVAALALHLNSQVFGFSTDAQKLKDKKGALINYDPKRGMDQLEIKLSEKSHEKFDLSATSLFGLHNRMNLAATILAARLWGIAREPIEEVVKNFQTLSHRLEPLFSAEGRMIINDSKSTTVASSLAALTAVRERFPARRLSLLLGGLAKAGSWEPLMQAILDQGAGILPVVCFGKDARIIADHCKQRGIAYSLALDVEEALHSALRSSSAEDIVLFSPGCASFDQFRDFEERGEYLRALVVSKGTDEYCTSR